MKRALFHINGPEILSVEAGGYIVCERRKSRPRMQIRVCLRCRWNKNCRALMDHVQPTLFPMGEDQGEKPSGRRRKAASTHSRQPLGRELGHGRKRS